MSDTGVKQTRLFRTGEQPHDFIDARPDPPPWRRFSDEAQTERGAKFHANDEIEELVNAALLLRRPLLVTGRPGTGKSSLAFAVAWQLRLGKVLHWSITTRSTLQQGLYMYDALARLQDASLIRARMRETRSISVTTDLDTDLGLTQDIGRYIRLGPLGTALLPPPAEDGGKRRPRVLLIDEIDKSDVDLPNDLLNIFEEGRFEIPELARLPEEAEFEEVEVQLSDTYRKARIRRGQVRCDTFPCVVMTSNGEREFPPAFLRRCLRLDVKPPTQEQLLEIVLDRLGPRPEERAEVEELLAKFVDLRDTKKLEMATDQLLNAVYMVMNGVDPMKREKLRTALFRSLSEFQ